MKDFLFVISDPEGLKTEMIHNSLSLLDLLSRAGLVLSRQVMFNSF